MNTKESKKLGSCESQDSLSASPKDQLITRVLPE